MSDDSKKGPDPDKPLNSTEGGGKRSGEVEDPDVTRIREDSPRSQKNSPPDDDATILPTGGRRSAGKQDPDATQIRPDGFRPSKATSPSASASADKPDPDATVLPEGRRHQPKKPTTPTTREQSLARETGEDHNKVDPDATLLPENRNRQPSGKSVGASADKPSAPVKSESPGAAAKSKGVDEKSENAAKASSKSLASNSADSAGTGTGTGTGTAKAVGGKTSKPAVGGKSKAEVVEPAAGADATIIREDREELHQQGKIDADSTIMREDKAEIHDAKPKIGSRDPTIRSYDKSSDKRDPRDTEPLPNQTLVRDVPVEEAQDRPAPDAEDGDGTILRDPEKVATELRPANQSATILREPARNESATILRAPDEDGATNVRSQEDDDRTIMNPDIDEDATIIGGNGQFDTTYVAAAEGASEQKGSSEAGRLLKNRFVLEEKVGSGGMGDVYKALDLRAQEAQERNPYVAIKLLNESFSRHKDAFISLQREASKTRNIPHPNIMGVYDFDREGDTYFMSMELLDGEPLDDYLKGHPGAVPREDALNIIDGICKGLMRAHQAGIVHSDFKPGNIYYCSDKNAKVFDFGIARAVKSPLEAEGEKTVFDAGSLGALTPTYASYEMLTGEEPAMSDDVYAVALVTYELFTGKHPFNRTPADKARERGLKPEPIPGLKRRQWKALRKALEFQSDKRTTSIEEFHTIFFSEDPPYFTYAAVASVMVAAISFGLYNYLNPETMNPELLKQQEMYGAQTFSVEQLLRNPDLEDEKWHDDLFTAVNRVNFVSITLKEDFAETEEEETEETFAARNEEYRKYRTQAQKIYLEGIAQIQRENAGVTDVGNPLAVEAVEITDEMSRQEIEFSEQKKLVEASLAELEVAKGFLDKVKARYQMDSSQIFAVESPLMTTIGLKQYRLDELDRQLGDATSARITAAESEAARLAEEERIAARNELYTQQRGVLADILRSCKGNLEDNQLAQLGDVLGGMQNTWAAQYTEDKEKIVLYLRECIVTRIGTTKPDRAREVQAIMMGFLPSEPILANIEIEDIDPCSVRGLEGRGSRSRAWCADELSGEGSGPQLVVIPAGNQLPKFAISKTEVKIGDYNVFCELTGCAQLAGTPSLPATNLSLVQAQAYTGWLSEQSGKTYRLPTIDEWYYAARPEEKPDDNINCTVESRGVKLGDSLRNTESGKPNSWGLYNYIGNAQEWAIAPIEEGADAPKVFALGGAHTDPKAQCTINRSVVHEGKADPVTGFRIVREIASGTNGSLRNSVSST